MSVGCLTPAILLRRIHIVAARLRAAFSSERRQQQLLVMWPCHGVSFSKSFSLRNAFPLALTTTGVPLEAKLKRLGCAAYFGIEGSSTSSSSDSSHGQFVQSQTFATRMTVPDGIESCDKTKRLRYSGLGVM